MALPSSSVSPLALVLSNRSLPPRSTIHSLFTSLLASKASPRRNMLILVKLESSSKATSRSGSKAYRHLINFLCQWAFCRRTSGNTVPYRSDGSNRPSPSAICSRTHPPGKGKRIRTVALAGVPGWSRRGNNRRVLASLRRDGSKDEAG
ncbi:hypothetical protein V8G54_009395 [Vigna mungo]|uniref:Uncharacterized protein n=1 Tax=Vigna mungo TaxID=3915 RepID=A0AAQ3S4T6_VIGMU